MKQYFIRIDRWYYAKNQLEEAAVEMAQKELVHQLVNENDLRAFWLSVDDKIKRLNIHHRRAKPLSRFEGTSRFQQKIGRTNIDDLIIMEMVEVKGTFLTEQSPKIPTPVVPIDLFVGPAESGKTRKAHEMYDGKKAAWIDGRAFNHNNLRTSFHIVQNDTEVIIIDDLPSHILASTVFALSIDELTINPKYRSEFTIPRPKIVIICNIDRDALPSAYSFHRRVSITVFPEKGGEAA